MSEHVDRHPHLTLTLLTLLQKIVLGAFEARRNSLTLLSYTLYIRIEYVLFV